MFLFRLIADLLLNFNANHFLIISPGQVIDPGQCWCLRTCWNGESAGEVRKQRRDKATRKYLLESKEKRRGSNPRSLHTQSTHPRAEQESPDPDLCTSLCLFLLCVSVYLFWPFLGDDDQLTSNLSKCWAAGTEEEKTQNKRRKTTVRSFIIKV